MNIHTNIENPHSIPISQENIGTHTATASYLPANPHEVDDYKKSDVFKDYWWNIKSIYKGTAGHTTYYNCGLKKHNQCPASLKIRQLDESKFLIFTKSSHKTTCKHQKPLSFLFMAEQAINGKITKKYDIIEYVESKF